MSAVIVRFGILMWLCTALGFGCSGKPFCEDSRTCGGSSAGGAGNAGEPIGGEPSAGQGAGGRPLVVGTTGDSSDGDGGMGAINAVAPACARDDDCDDLDSCTGIEACVEGVCEAGEAVECPVGMECSAEQDDACVFSSAAPWIVYVADDEMSGLFEAFAVKSDLVGKMEPLKISVELDVGWEVEGIGPWSPDGTTVVLSVRGPDEQGYRAYAVRLADKLPEAALLLTEGLAPSNLQSVSWSPSSQALLVTRADGLYVAPNRPGEVVTPARVNSAGFHDFSGVLRSDKEVVWVGQRQSTQKWQIARALDQGQGWVQDVLVTDQPITWTWLTDANLALYGRNDGSARYVYALETKTAAQPIQLAGPAAEVAVAGSPDFSYLMLAISANGGRDSSLYGGPASGGAPLPLLAGPFSLYPNEVVDLTGSPFAPDGSRAALFQQSGTLGLRQLVVCDLAGVEPCTPLPSRQAPTDGPPKWSPDSSLIALPTRTSITSDLRVALVSVPGDQVHDLAIVPRGQLWWSSSTFSAGGELFFYAHGPSDARRGAYADLRSGVEQAVAHDHIGQAFQGWSLPTHGTDALYLDGPELERDCFYLDLSAEVAAEPVRVNGAGTTRACSFQQLP